MKFQSIMMILELLIFNNFKYKVALRWKTVDAVTNTNSSIKNTEIIVLSNYFSNFWKSLEMSLTNCKIQLESNCIEDCVLSSAWDSAKCKMIDAKLHVPIVTLSTKDNVSLTKHLSNGFEGSVYWINYQTISAKITNNGNELTLRIINNKISIDCSCLWCSRW